MSRIGILNLREAYALHARTDRLIRYNVAACLSQNRLSLMEWLLLAVLSSQNRKAVNMTAIAGELGITLPQVTALMSGLVAKRLARQTTLKQDKRGRVAFITQRGEDLLTELEPKMLETLSKTYKNLQPGELVNYQKALRLIAGGQ